MAYADNMEPVDTEEPTPEELQAIENEKTRRALVLTQAMHQQESQLPASLPTQPTPAPLQPPGFENALISEETRLNQGREARATAPGGGVLLMPPETQGRMYMGPQIGAEQLARIPQGGRINLMPPPGPRMSQLEQAQAADRPGTRTVGISGGEPSITSIEPAMQHFAAMRGYQSDLERGGDKQVARDKWLPMMLTGTRGLTPFQQAQIDRWQQPKTATPYQEAQMERWKNEVKTDPARTAQISKLTGAITGLQSDMARGLAYSSDNPDPKKAAQGKKNEDQLKQWQEQLDSLAKPATTTKTSAVANPAKASPGKNPYIVGKRYGNLRYKGGDPNLESSWTKAT
jgi:organic radical activating enzyme